MNWKQRYECKLFDKILPIWEKKKEEGMVVIAPRQSGKTTTLIRLALQEVKLEHNVIIWTPTEAHTDHIMQIIIQQIEIIPNNLKIYCIHQPVPIHEPNFEFYDEIDKGKIPYSLVIRSLQSSNNTYIFNIDNLKTNIDKKRLKEFKEQISHDQFLAEFKSGVM